MTKKQRLTFAVPSFLIGVALFFGIHTVFATAVNYNVDGKVTICHATASHTNPYVQESPNIKNDGSLTGGHLNHTGGVFPTANWGDIIPPYSSGNFHYLGLNWTTAGQAIWNNGCKIPTPTPTPTKTPTPTVTPTVTPTPTINPCEDDKDWKECVTPTPTPTVTPSPTPTPCVVWEGEFPVPCPTETPTPTVTPTPTPDQPSNTSSGNGGGSVSAPVCSDGNTVQLPANPFVVRKGSEATVNFFITEGDSANIYYKVVGQQNWQYSVLDVKPNGEHFVSFTIQGLDPKLGYDFGIQQKQGCGGGQLVTAVIIDGPQARTFTFSYWEWSK